MGPTGSSAVIQIHPTRRCNLRCLHCYSLSGPEERDEVSPALLCSAIKDASEEGYTIVGVSGGEPLLFKPLEYLLDFSHGCGMRTTVTSNGMLLDERALEKLKGRVDLLAISIDGLPASHNRMRAHASAFEKMQSRLEAVRRSGIPFGFIFTLTQYNLHELSWVAKFSLAEGARLLQIHPLEEVGRADEHLAGEQPDDVEASFAFVAATKLQEALRDKLYVQLDLASREQLKAFPERVFASGDDFDPMKKTLADLLTPLVIEADGTVVPMQYGFSREYALGNLREAPLRELGRLWRQARWPSFSRLCKDVFEEVTSSDALPMVNWYELITRESHQAPRIRV